GFAQEAFQLGPLWQVAGPRHLQRHDPVQFGIAGPVDRAERPLADQGQELEAAKPLAPDWRPAGGRASLRATGRPPRVPSGGGKCPPGGRAFRQVETVAARRANDFLVGAETDQLDGIAAVWAEDVHGVPRSRATGHASRWGQL